MSNYGLLIVMASLVSLAGLFCFNDRFRKETFRSAMKWKVLLFGPIILYGFFALMFGVTATNSMVPAAIMGVLQIIMLMFMMVVQWIAMMWIMARPRIDWYMPGESMDNLTWDDYVGNDEIRDRVRDLMDFIKSPEKYRKLGAKIPKGILMLGEPGVGKTYLARIIANEAQIPIAICESSSMQSPFVAVGALMVKALYRKLRKYAAEYGSAMVFFDEIDAIGMSRQGQGGMGSTMSFFGGGSGSGILNALLGCMDGINSTEGYFKRLARRYNLVSKDKRSAPVTVITIGATNAPIESLDKALVREGRFDWKIYVKTSGDKGREEQIRYFLKKRNPDDTVEMGQLVSDFRGETPVAIDAVLNAAVIRAIRDGREQISYNDILKSLWDRNFGLPSPITLGDLDSKRVAYHEGGHAIMAVLFPMTGWQCWGASIVPRGNALGMVVSKPHLEIHTASQEDLSRNLLLSVGSRAVEETVLKIKMNGFSGDLQSATSVAIAMLSAYGMGERLLSFAAVGQQTNPKVLEEAELIIRAHLELAKELVAENQEAVDAVSLTLLEKTELDGREVREIIKAKAKTQDLDKYSVWENASRHLERLKAEAKKKRLAEARELKMLEGDGGELAAPQADGHTSA